MLYAMCSRRGVYTKYLQFNEHRSTRGGGGGWKEGLGEVSHFFVYVNVENALFSTTEVLAIES